MKAPSLILESVQTPTTFYGVPMMLVMLVFGASASVFAVMWGMMEGGAMGFVLFLAMAGGGMLWSWRARVRDPHVEEVLRHGHEFWRRWSWRRPWRLRGHKDFRVLAAGGPGETP